MLSVSLTSAVPDFISVRESDGQRSTVFIKEYRELFRIYMYCLNTSFCYIKLTIRLKWLVWIYLREKSRKLDCNMEQGQLRLLKSFVEVCKKNPAVLYSPGLEFYREWLISLGATLPESKISFPTFENVHVLYNQILLWLRILKVLLSSVCIRKW